MRVRSGNLGMPLCASQAFRGFSLLTLIPHPSSLSHGATLNTVSTAPCTPSNDMLVAPVTVFGAKPPIDNVMWSSRYEDDAVSRTVTITSSAAAAGGITAIVEHCPAVSDRGWN